MLKRIYDIENIAESQPVRAKGLKFPGLGRGLPAALGGGRLVGRSKGNR